MPTTCYVGLRIYDLSGRLIRSLVDDIKAGGFYTVRWDSRDELGECVGSGVYFVKLKVGERFSQVRKVLILK